jgi:hypothetical protein
MFRNIYTKLAAAQQQIAKTFFRFPFVFSFSAFTVLNLWFAMHDRTTPYFDGVSAIANSRRPTGAWVGLIQAPTLRWVSHKQNLANCQKI